MDELSSESLNASQAAITLGERLDDEDKDDKEGAIVKLWMRFDSGDESDKPAWVGLLCSDDANDEVSSSKAWQILRALVANADDNADDEEASSNTWAMSLVAEAKDEEAILIAWHMPLIVDETECDSVNIHWLPGLTWCIVKQPAKSDEDGEMCPPAGKLPMGDSV